ncbi:MAG: hypothetical protein WC773_00310 [Patescibacteria group bacterium]
MKIFNSELMQDYGTYTFGYTTYAVREDGDKLADIYNLGFLPYTGTKGINNMYYMSRSVRIKLDDWQMNSENRRIYAKFNDLKSTLIPITKFDTHDPKFVHFCLHYFGERFGERVMPESRFRQILDMGVITDIIEYKKDNEVFGYCFLIQDDQMSHYIYSFYNLEHFSNSLGLWLMTDCIKYAKDDGKKYHYLGTAYGDKGLYKTNFDQLEFWNGERWVDSRDQLRDRCRSDAGRQVHLVDEWKQRQAERFQ